MRMLLFFTWQFVTERKQIALFRHEKLFALSRAVLRNESLRNEVAMANVITDETMDYVGILAKLELSGEEKERAKRDMEEMLDYIDKLNELDTTDVEPMSHVFPVHNVFREDVVTNGNGQETTLANAPERNGDSFLVPKTIV